MSELKAFVARKIDDGTCDPAPCVAVYLKSEADDVITELKDKLRHYPLMVAMLEYDKLESLHYVHKIRHQKYKRCLDNAWGCRQRMELFHELVLEEARTIALPNEKALKEYRSKRERAAKWRKRWLKIAEQFKEV